mgnify:FL=1
MNVISGVFGAAFAFLAVALGAFGAHGLEGRVSPNDLAVFETGARYQMYHALALLLLALLSPGLPEKLARISGLAFILGILLFSGSLYLLVLTGVRGLGAVTPFGGVSFLVGWGTLAWAFFRRDHV